MLASSASEALAFAHQAQRNLAHRREIAAGSDTALFANHRRHALVEHGHVGLGNHQAAAGVALGVHVDPPEHGRPHDLFRKRIADAGIDPVHDLPGFDLAFEHGSAALNRPGRVTGQFHTLTVSGHGDDVFDRQTVSIQRHRHPLFS